MNKQYIVMKHKMEAIDRHNAFKASGISPVMKLHNMRLRHDPEYAKFVKKIGRKKMEVVL